MPRLLVLCEYPTLNGGEFSLLSLLPAIQAAGFEPCFAVPPAGPLADFVSARGWQIISWKLWDDAGQRVSLPEARSGLQALLQDVRPDLLHANSLAMSRLSGPVGQQCGLPSIGHLRDIVRISRAAVRDVNCQRRLLAVSAATRHWHVAHGMDASRTVVMRNGVDLSRFQPRAVSGDLHRELGMPPSCPLVGGIGQLIMRKGWDLWLDAAERLARERPDVRFVIVGERYSKKAEAVEFEERLRQRAVTPLLRGRCVFLGVRQDVSQLLNEFQVLMHMARQEPLGRVLLEAAACGTPIVATRVGGTEEILPRDSSGLVPAEDPVAAAEQVKRLLEDSDLYARESARLRRTAEQYFDAESVARQLLAHYDDVLQA